MLFNFLAKQNKNNCPSRNGKYISIICHVTSNIFVKILPHKKKMYKCFLILSSWTLQPPKILCTLNFWLAVQANRKIANDNEV